MLITVDTIGEIFMLIVVAGFDATKNRFISSYARKNYLKMRRDKHSYIMNTINLAWDGGKASTPEAPSCALRRYVKSLYRHFFLEDIAKHARVTQKNGTFQMACPLIPRHLELQTQNLFCGLLTP